MTNQIQKTEDPTKALINLIESQKTQIARALPKHLSADRMARIVLTEIRRTPKLLQCDKMSFLGGVIQCAQLGLEPGNGLGHAYLIPYGKECVLVPGFKGLIDLARRSERVGSISARIVWSADEFEWEYGDDERIRHVPSANPRDDSWTITHAYAIARDPDGKIMNREVMTRAQVDAIMNRAKYKNEVWVSDFDEMARKTAVRRICKYLPLSPQLAGALEKDNEAFDGKSQRNWEVIDVNYTPAPDEVDVAKGNAVRDDSSPPPPMAHEKTAMDAERKAAIEKFQASHEAFKARGGKLEDHIKQPVNELLQLPAARLLAAAAILDKQGKA